MSNAPCKGCEKRHRACHDTCSVYMEWKKSVQAAKVEGLTPADHVMINSMYQRRKRRHHRG